jgi:hypothetical protein
MGDANLNAQFIGKRLQVLLEDVVTAAVAAPTVALTSGSCSRTMFYIRILARISAFCGETDYSDRSLE